MLFRKLYPDAAQFRPLDVTLYQVWQLIQDPNIHTFLNLCTIKTPFSFEDLISFIAHLPPKFSYLTLPKIDGEWEVKELLANLPPHIIGLDLAHTEVCRTGEEANLFARLIPSTVTLLGLNSCGLFYLTTSQLIEFAENLPRNLTHLALNGIDFSTRDVFELERFIHALPRVDYLDLSSNKIGRKPAEEIQILLSAIGASQIDLSWNFLAMCPDKDKIPSAIGTIGATAPNSSPVTSLTIGNNDLASLPYSTMHELAANLPRSLRYLDMERSYLELHSHRAIKILKELPTLRKVKLDHNFPRTKPGQIATYLANLPDSLEEFSLEDYPVENISSEDAAGILQSMPQKLIYLDLGSLSVTDNAHSTTLLSNLPSGLLTLNMRTVPKSSIHFFSDSIAPYIAKSAVTRVLGIQHTPAIAAALRKNQFIRARYLLAVGAALAKCGLIDANLINLIMCFDLQSSQSGVPRYLQSGSLQPPQPGWDTKDGQTVIWGNQLGQNRYGRFLLAPAPPYATESSAAHQLIS